MAVAPNIKDTGAPCKDGDKRSNIWRIVILAQNQFL